MGKSEQKECPLWYYWFTFLLIVVFFFVNSSFIQNILFGHVGGQGTFQFDRELAYLFILFSLLINLPFFFIFLIKKYKKNSLILPLIFIFLFIINIIPVGTYLSYLLILLGFLFALIYSVNSLIKRKGVSEDFIFRYYLYFFLAYLILDITYVIITRFFGFAIQDLYYNLFADFIIFNSGGFFLEDLNWIPLLLLILGINLPILIYCIKKKFKIRFVLVPIFVSLLIVLQPLFINIVNYIDPTTNYIQPIFPGLNFISGLHYSIGFAEQVCRLVLYTFLFGGFLLYLMSKRNKG